MPDSAVLKLLIVDDVPIIRDLVKITLANRSYVQVIGEAANGEEALEAVEVLKPDIVLMDIEMPIMDGIKASKIIHQKHQDVKIIMLTACSNERLIFKSFEAGAEGYILKDRFQESVEVAIRTVQLGSVWLDPAISQLILVAATNSPRKEREANIGELLTAEERETLNEVAECSGSTCLVDPAFVAKLHRLAQTQNN